MERSREEHLAWSKARALAYVEAGDLQNAVASMGSDLSKHEAFQAPSYSFLNYMGIMAIRDGPSAVRRWIEGFN